MSSVQRRPSTGPCGSQTSLFWYVWYIHYYYYYYYTTTTPLHSLHYNYYYDSDMSDISSVTTTNIPAAAGATATTTTTTTTTILICVISSRVCSSLLQLDWTCCSLTSSILSVHSLCHMYTHVCILSVRHVQTLYHTYTHVCILSVLWMTSSWGIDNSCMLAGTPPHDDDDDERSWVLPVGLNDGRLSLCWGPSHGGASSSSSSSSSSNSSSSNSCSCCCCLSLRPAPSHGGASVADVDLCSNEAVFSFSITNVMHVKNNFNKSWSRLSTARGPCLCNISWIQANCTLQRHKRHQANAFLARLIIAWRVTHTQKNLDLWPMTLIFNRLLEVVEVHVHASAAVHELSCWQRQNLATGLKTILPLLSRAIKTLKSICYEKNIFQKLIRKRRIKNVILFLLELLAEYIASE